MSKSDHSLLQWMVVLLSHILSSVLLSSDLKCSLFVPLSTNPPSASSLNGGEVPHNETKEKGSSKEVLMERSREVKKMLVNMHSLIDVASNDLDKITLKHHFQTKLNVSNYFGRYIDCCE